MVFATVPTADFAWRKGADIVRLFTSSGFESRSFCGQCGTLFTMQVDHQPETVDFSVATLDEPERVTPGFHIFWGSRIGWAERADALPRHDKFRPEMRGLDETEPPA